MPEDVERLVKKLEKHPEIEEPWGLAVHMKQRGYKMPKKAEEEKKQFSPKTISPKTKIPRYKSSEDMVYPDEFKLGMKKEMEHSKDKETTKQIVLDHLKEDPHYYTKFETMKAEESWGDDLKVQLDKTMKKKRTPKSSLPKNPPYGKPFGSADEKVTTKENELNELYCFLKWLQDKSFKAESKEDLKKLQDQYAIHKFSEEEKEKPAEYHAEEGILDGVKKILNPAPKQPKTETHAPLTKKTMTNIVRKIKSGV